MQKLDRSKLLQFLSKPRYACEVANYFNIPSKLANYHLREAVKSGHALVSEKRVSGSFLNLRGKLKRLGGFLYVYRNSSLLVKGSLQLIMKKDEGFASTSTTGVTPVKFISKVRSSRKKSLPEQEISAFTDRKAANTRIGGNRFKSKVNLVSPFLNVFAVKGRLGKRGVWNQPLRRERPLSQSSYKPLSHAERIRLFKAVSDQPLTFLELHGRFGVSKQVIENFVRRGLFEEVWGPRDIGVQFRLTEKGKRSLKELEAAASFEPPKRKKFFHLKHTTFS